jgi:SAM-dependent methyltransferase
MCRPPEDDVPPCCFDDWAKADARRARTGKTVPVVRAMLDALEAVGLADRTLLDVGCGSGDLALGALARGAVSVRGVDLGSGAIHAAQTLATDRGLEQRATFEVGDGSRDRLAPADVVTLSRVVCCYADPRSLLDNAIPAAHAVLAFSAPADRGLAGLMNRALVATSNIWYALRPARFQGFRVFVHDLDAIDERVRDGGFTQRHRSRQRFVWELAVYERSPVPVTGR